MKSAQYADICKLKPKHLYIALEEYDFTWEREEVGQVIQLWKEGKDINEIVEAVRNTQKGQIEVFLLLLDLAQKNRIQERKGGIFGEA